MNTQRSTSNAQLSRVGVSEGNLPAGDRDRMSLLRGMEESAVAKASVVGKPMADETVAKRLRLGAYLGRTALTERGYSGGLSWRHYAEGVDAKNTYSAKRTGLKIAELSAEVVVHQEVVKNGGIFSIRFVWPVRRS